VQIYYFYPAREPLRYIRTAIFEGGESLNPIENQITLHTNEHSLNYLLTISGTTKSMKEVTRNHNPLV